ncbi:hypothetical protein L7F22_065006 [Adiantum nelumboides]|nr:hypothetical protein [Adiantum nelumboides]
MASSSCMSLLPASAGHAFSGSSTNGSSSRSSSGSSGSASLMVVRCNKESERGNNPIAQATPSLSGLQEKIDSVTKKPLSRADVERHQVETSSEKQSILGTRPASTVPWPRPELERRPETGDRSLGSLFAVDGAAPETINGRMAMVGFVWALVAEKMTGLTVMEQLFNPATSGILWFGAVVQLFTLASIIPFVNGESTDARSFGPFNARAERWNGRLAMIGFAALLIDEMIRQGPLIH